MRLIAERKLWQSLNFKSFKFGTILIWKFGYIGIMKICLNFISEWSDPHMSNSRDRRAPSTTLRIILLLKTSCLESSYPSHPRGRFSPRFTVLHYSLLHILEYPKTSPPPSQFFKQINYKRTSKAWSMTWWWKCVVPGCSGPIRE